MYEKETKWQSFCGTMATIVTLGWVIFFIAVLIT